MERSFNEAAADTAENDPAARRMDPTVLIASMRPRPIPRKTSSAAPPTPWGAPRFNEAAADTAENVEARGGGSWDYHPLQ